MGTNPAAVKGGRAPVHMRTCQQSAVCCSPNVGDLFSVLNSPLLTDCTAGSRPVILGNGGAKWGATKKQGQFDSIRSRKDGGGPAPGRVGAASSRCLPFPSCASLLLPVSDGDLWLGGSDSEQVQIE